MEPSVNWVRLSTMTRTPSLSGPPALGRRTQASKEKLPVWKFLAGELGKSMYGVTPELKQKDWLTYPAVDVGPPTEVPVPPPARSRKRSGLSNGDQKTMLVGGGVHPGMRQEKSVR